MHDWDEDALIAAVDLVHRSGARGFEVGHLEDEVPIEQARWWASAQYKGARIQVDEHRGPVEAAEALARRVLKGARCVGCNRTVALHGIGARERCRWTREGKHWMPSCPAGRKRLTDRLRTEPEPEDSPGVP